MWNDFLEDRREQGITCIMFEDVKCVDCVMQHNQLCIQCFRAWKDERCL